MNFTKEQEQAIYETGHNIIVSAGAGSGKTAVLTERILEKLKSGISIDELVVLTFTNAAAFEMKERVRKKIMAELEKGNLSLKSQLDLLDTANICTFDSYSLSLVKKYHYLLGLEKEVNICDAVMMMGKKKELIDEVFCELFEEGNIKFLTFMDTFTLKDDVKMQEVLLKLYEKLQTFQKKNEFLDTYIETYFSASFEEKILKDYTCIIKREVERLYILLEQLENKIKDEQLRVWYENMVETLEPLFDVKTYDQFVMLYPSSLPSLPRSKKIDEEEKEEIKPTYDLVKKSYQKIGNLLSYESTEAILEAYRSTKSSVEVIIFILKRFIEKLNAFQRKYQVFDFSDIGALAIELLEKHEDIRMIYKEHIKEIMIDEYQDTNDIGDYFISLIARDNVYMVGDVKQSIYSFRNANPSIFMEKYDRYGKGDGGVKIDLMKNFRSRKEVLDSINFLFERLMDENLGGVDYQNGHEMIFGNLSYDEKGSCAVNHEMEILDYQHLDRSYRKEEIEAFLIARDIKEKVENKYPVFDMKSFQIRPITYGDITILMDRKTTFDLYKKIFTYLQIPIHIHKEEGFVIAGEIFAFNNILNLLLCIQNKDFNSTTFRHHAIAFLRSFVNEKKDEEIFDLFVQSKKEEISFYQAWRQSKSCASVLDKIMTLSKKVEELPIGELVKKIVDEFELYEKLNHKMDVQLSHQKLSYCMELAENLETLGYQLEEFTHYFEIAYQGNIDVQFQSGTAKSKNAVQVMSIHKSKGLEFPVCYYSGLYKQFSKEDFKERYLLNHTYGFVVPIFQEGLKETILKTLVKEAYYEKDVSEKIRLFYVATTRAKEKMILVAPLQEHVTEMDDTSFANKLTYRSFLDMLVSVKHALNPYCKSVSADDILTHQYDQPELQLKKECVVAKKEYYHHPNEKVIMDRSHFSKRIGIVSKEEMEWMEIGTKFHAYLEYIDWNDRETFYKKNKVSPNIQEKLEQFFSSPLIKNLKPIHLYREYEFLQENAHGIIDLLIETEEKMIIIDYKLKEINSDLYVEQLQGYRSYLKNKTEKPIDCYLYSIFSGTWKKISET